MVQLAKWAQVEQAVQEYQLRTQLVIFIYNGQAGNSNDPVLANSNLYAKRNDWIYI
jgi:hypothetical protein